MKAEQVFKRYPQINFEMFPTPRTISSECGFSLRADGLPEQRLEGIDAVYTINVTEEGVTQYVKED